LGGRNDLAWVSCKQAKCRKLFGRQVNHSLIAKQCSVRLKPETSKVEFCLALGESSNKRMGVQLPQLRGWADLFLFSYQRLPPVNCHHWLLEFCQLLQDKTQPSAGAFTTPARDIRGRRKQEQEKVWATWDPDHLV